MAEHLLVKCTWSCELSDHIADKFAIATLHPVSWPPPPLSALHGCLATLSSTPAPQVKTGKSLATIWAIWRERNTRIFHDHATTPAVAVQLLFDEAASWAARR